MSLKGIPDPAVLGVVALTQPINLDIESLDEYGRFLNDYFCLLYNFITFL